MDGAASTTGKHVGRTFSWLHGLSKLRRSDHDQRRCVHCVCAGSAATAGFVTVPLVCLRQITPVDDAVGIGCYSRRQFCRTDDHLFDGSLIDNVLVPWQEGRTVTGHPAWWYLAGMLGASLTAWLLNWARLYVTSCVSERIASDLRTQTYAHLQQLSLEFFGGKRTGDLMSRISTDTDRICVFLSVSLVDFVNDVVMIIVTAGLLMWKDARLAACTLTTFPIIVWLVYGVRRRLRHGFDQSIVATAQLNSVLADTIPGIRVVKAFAQEHREIERFDRTNRHLVSINDRVNVIWSFFGPLVTLLTDIGLLGVWIFGVWLVFSTASGAATVLQVGTLVVFAGLMNKFFGRMESMLRIVYATQRAAASSHRILKFSIACPAFQSPASRFIRGDWKDELKCAACDSNMAREKCCTELTWPSRRAK